MATESRIREMAPKQCPKCGKFVEVLVVPEGSRKIGVYCNGEDKTCDWKDNLPEEMDPVRNYKDYVQPTLVDLLRLCPSNPTVRKLLQAQFLKPVPEVCQTFEEIIYWVNRVATRAAARPILAMAPLQMNVLHEYVGKVVATMKNRYRGTYRLSLPPEILRDMVIKASEGGVSWGGFDENMQSLIQDYVNRMRPNMPLCDTNTINEDDYEESQRTSYISSSDVDALVRRWMTAYTPELLERIHR